MPIQKLPLSGYIYSSIGLSVLTALLVIITKFNLPPVVPLFYGRPVGPEQLVGAWGLIVAPGVSLLITVINIILASRLSDDFSKRVLSVTSLFISVLIAVTVFKIISLVGFW